MKDPPPFRLVRFLGCRMIFTRALPRVFDRTEVARRIHDMFGGRLPQDYVMVRVSTSARSEGGAVEKCLDSLNILRGVWNLCLTYGKTVMTMGGRAKGPVGKIVIGPVHTLHCPNGKLATPIFWYETVYTDPAESVKIMSISQMFVKHQRWVRQQVVKAADHKRLARAFVRYADALDEPFLDHAFFKLWGLLECLTATEKQSYEHTIRRAAFLWKDYDFAFQELRYLKDLRNRAIHRGESVEDSESRVYQLKKYVDHLFAFLLHPGNMRETIEQGAGLLDLPHDIENLGRGMRLARKALRLRSH